MMVAMREPGGEQRLGGGAGAKGIWFCEDPEAEGGPPGEGGGFGGEDEGEGEECGGAVDEGEGESRRP